MPIFTAAGWRAAIAPASASRTAAGARGSTRWMASPCSVQAVPRACARAPRAAAVATSRSSPAPPEGSMPPTTTTTTDAFVCGGFTRPLSYNAPPRAPPGTPPKVLPVATQLPEPIQFGKYTLFERIGRGGMAEVYKGRIQGPAGFERVFVVKRILPHLSDDTTFIKMFVEEAKLSARLNHPNIVHIFELGAVEGEYFISMEYIRGHDLSETMRAIWKALGPPRPGAGRLHRPRGLSRARLRAQPHRRERPPARHDPPRRLAVERDAVVRGRGEDARLRHRQGAGRRRRADEERHHEGQVRLHGARADRGRQHRPPQRHLRVRHRAARGADRAPPVQGAERRPDDRARAPLRGAAAVGAEPGRAARAR